MYARYTGTSLTFCDLASFLSIPTAWMTPALDICHLTDNIDMHKLLMRTLHHQNFSYLFYIDAHRCIPSFASSFALCERTEGLESGKGSCNDVLTAVLVGICPKFELC